MKCDACENEKATIFLTSMADGVVQKVNLCKSCADNKGVTDPTSYALTEMLSGMGQESEPSGKTAVAASTEKEGGLTCRGCGFTQAEFKKTGRFGCASCYETFHEGLDSLLDAMHKHTQHRGKRPASFPARHETTERDPTSPITPMAAPESLEERLSKLRLALSKSVEDEDYEEAARLRDSISRIESQL
jgi:protein arginine kinase activator